MANWESYRLVDVIHDIENENYVLPVIQRYFVWTEEKIELLFDTLLKGDSFGGIMVIKEEKGTIPLFSFRPFTKNGETVSSRPVNTLIHDQMFIIDGQQRLQSFYIGLKGSINNKVLFFDLFSDRSEFEFKFESDEKKLPKTANDDGDRCIKQRLWYCAKDLFKDLKDTDDEDMIADKIINTYSINDDSQKVSIRRNVKFFYKNVISSKTIGMSIVSVNKSLPELDNRQRIVEMFRRLNDGGTKLSAFDLVASILKGFSWEMEGFLRDNLEKYEYIGLSQDNLIKLIFLLQDNPYKEMASIEASDAEFAIRKKNRIEASLNAVKVFLDSSKLTDYYKDGNRSFIPLFFIAYHVFHKDIPDNAVASYFDNYEVGNSDFKPMQTWIYHSLINGVFRSKNAGWIPYRTGVRKILDVMKKHKNSLFPTQDLFDVYTNHPVIFTKHYDLNNIDNLNRPFLYYLLYDRTRPIRTNDIDHIMPKSILESMSYDWNDINSVKNFQLLDYGTNRGEKNGKPFKSWVNNPSYVSDKKTYCKTHLIPEDESLWDEERFLDFSKARGEKILNKIASFF